MIVIVTVVVGNGEPLIIEHEHAPAVRGPELLHAERLAGRSEGVHAPGEQQHAIGP
jgi:hypothetical protein